MPVTYFIIALTALVSIMAFNNYELFSKLQFNAYQVVHKKQYYRLITHAFVHANWWHLFMNMLVLYFFGSVVELYLHQPPPGVVIKFPTLIYVLFYFASIVFASSMGLAKHKNDIWYNAVGASGAVSAVLYFSIFFNPWHLIRVYLIPVPGIVFALLYVVYSHYQAKKGGDNIAHDAHLLGAIFGFVFPLFLDLKLFNYFLKELMAYE